MKVKKLWLIAAIANLIGAWYFEKPVIGFFSGCALILFYYLSWICELLQAIEPTNTTNKE